jgi:hypothetical protein
VPSRIRTYREILRDPDTGDARSAIEKLTTKHGVIAFDLQLRIEWFRAWEHFGTGRRWSERFTIDRDSAKKLAQRLRKDGEDLRKALTPRFKFLIGSSLSADTICDLISRSAVWIEGSLLETTDKGGDWACEPKAELTQFIVRTTGKPHDTEVADIVAAILRLEKYTAEEQRKFRYRWCREGAETMFDAISKPDKIAPING